MASGSSRRTAFFGSAFGGAGTCDFVSFAKRFTGPSRLAAWFRARVDEAAEWLGSESDRAGWTWLSPNAFVARYQSAFRIGTAVLAFLVLFRWKHPTPSVVFSLAVATLMILALIEFFGRDGTVAPAPASSPA